MCRSRSANTSSLLGVTIIRHKGRIADGRLALKNEKSLYGNFPAFDSSAYRIDMLQYEHDLFRSSCITLV